MHLTSRICMINLLLLASMLSLSSLAIQPLPPPPTTLDGQRSETQLATRRTRSPPRDILIGAFNIQTFGSSKLEKPDLMNIIVKILGRYDIILVQEIVDREREAMGKLMKLLNSRAGKRTFNYTINERIGRTTYKEQYAFIYRTSVIRALTKFSYDDRTHDVFERDPFVTTFEIIGSRGSHSLGPFSLIAIHTQPKNAVTELKNLPYVVDFVKSKIHTNNVMILGDFNADCSYVRKKDWPYLKLWTNKDYTWLIDTGKDTTATNSHCTYDRIVITGQRFTAAVIPGSNRVFRYDVEFGLRNHQQVLNVSDHYPVEVRLRTSIK